MKRYIHRLFTFLPALLLTLAGTGCADDIEPDTPAAAAPDSITLELTVPMEPSTRAAKTETDLNEFKVTSVHLYFYKSGEGDDVLSTYDYIIDTEFDTNNTVTVPMPANALDADGLFGSDADGAKCKVYAVANVDADGTLSPEGTPKSVNGLKALSVSSTFDETKVQDSFAMDGEAEIKLIDGAARRAKGTINLTRAAAKLTLTVDIPQSITVTEANGSGNTTEVTYKPNTGSMHVWIGNGVKTSPLNTAAAKPTDNKAFYSNKQSAEEYDGSAFTYVEEAEKYKYFQDVPFYSYPNKWEANSADGSTHMTLVVPWTPVNGDGNTAGEQKVTYYRLPVQPKECAIERNMHYDMRVSISRLGSVDPQTPVEMQVDWNYAIPWNKVDLETDIKAIRYLILNNNYYDSSIPAYVFEMNNETSTEITLGTSHPVEIAEVTLSWTDYSQSTPAKRTITLTPDGDYKYSSDTDSYNETGTPTDVYACIKVDNTTYKLILERAMLHIEGGGSTWVEGHYEWKEVNGRYDRVYVEGYWKENPITVTSNPALNTYTFDIKLQHEDDHQKTANVRIIQYPAIYITAEETTSSDYRFVNGTRNSNSLDDELGSIGDKGNQTNKNTYIITITRFDSNDDYVLADPRSRSINNSLSSNYPDDIAATWSTLAPPIKGETSRRLTYYYPADHSDSKIDYIAPKFRIASQWGVTSQVTKQGAKRRCASYQENGRPAGRWRLPTKAEIKYIADLSCKGYIPYLFGTGNDQADYWCASGAINVINQGTSSTVEDATGNYHFARCVYDEWYWGDDVCDKETFTWGDRPRTTSGNAVRKFFGL